MLHKAARMPFVQDHGGFVIRPNMPGWLLPWPRDHGHGPLAMVAETLLAPGRLVAMHEHRNDEIISWVPAGIMRHDDLTGRELIVDAEHLMVMNAGRSFSHAEQTLPTDPPLRMLQILVRPRALDLEPMIQHGAIVASQPNSWRHLFGPEGSNAPFFVRSALDFYDIRLGQGTRVAFPELPGRDLYFYVFSGAITAGGKSFSEAEQGLLQGGGALMLEATAPTILVAFLTDPNATMVRAGTIGDTPKIPPPLLARPLLGLLKLGQRLRRRRQAAGASVSM